MVIRKVSDAIELQVFITVTKKVVKIIVLNVFTSLLLKYEG